MSLTSRLLAQAMRLAPAETYDVLTERDLAIPMHDGIILRADRYAPRQGGKRPLILLRSPYGRAGILGTVYGRLYAERGFQVLIQSCRGTADSGGQLDPFRQEYADGMATLAWIQQQHWFNGQLATNGPSYLGLVQWAIAAEANPILQAIAAQVTSPDFRRTTYDGGAFSLDNSLGWTAMMSGGTRNKTLLSALRRLPLSNADTLVAGRQVQYWQDWLAHNQPGDTWWEAQNFWPKLEHVTAPAHLLGGWYDLFLPDTIRTYQELRRAGRTPYLVVGPWTHGDPRIHIAAVRETLAWFRAHLLGEMHLLRPQPVRIWVQGADEWRDYPAWPPQSYQPQRWHLQDARRLARHQPAQSPPERFRYDPNDPTPAIGGAILGAGAGRKKQHTFEARSDVVTYTSDVLERDLEVVGALQAEIYLRSSLEHSDLFVSVCDVDQRGISLNVCDGLQRLTSADSVAEDGSRLVTFALWPTAYRFRRGHRIRVQVAGGAHPRWARNPGSGEPLGTATTLVACDHEILHDPAHPSAVIFPVQA